MTPLRCDDSLLVYTISYYLDLAFMVLISQYPFSSILRHCNPVTRLVIHLALLQLVVQLEDGLSILLDRLIKVSSAPTLQTATTTVCDPPH